MPKSTKEPWQTTYKYIDSNRPNGRLERAHPVSYRPLTKHSIGKLYARNTLPRSFQATGLAVDSEEMIGLRV
jgi:hypothetical protein